MHVGLEQHAGVVVLEGHKVSLEMINQKGLLLCAQTTAGRQQGPEVLHQADQGWDPGARPDAQPVHVHQEGNHGHPGWSRTNKKVLPVEGQYRSG